MSIDALEARLRDDPGDWPTWLVYGDWLLEQGDARGELIRLEHQRSLAGARVGGDVVARIEALSKKHAGRWSPEVPPSAALGWTNGFVTSLSLPLDEATPGVLEAVLASPEARFLRSLRLHAPASEDPFDEDGEFDEEAMNAPPKPVHAPFAQACLALDLRRLRALSFAYAVIGADGARAVARAERLGPLVALDLRYAWIGDEGAAALAEAPLLAGVRTLSLTRCGIGPKGAAALAASPHLGALRELDLRYNELKTQGARAIAASPSLRGLERLLLYKADVGKPGARALGESPHLPVNLKRYWKSI